MNMVAKKALSAITTAADNVKVNKTTKSAHALQNKPAHEMVTNTLFDALSIYCDLYFRGACLYTVLDR